MRRILETVAVVTIGWLRDRVLGVIVWESTVPLPVIFRFSPAVTAAAVADFHTLRQRPDAVMSRARRRAAARAAWGAVERQQGESWVDFWGACLAARGAM